MKIRHLKQLATATVIGMLATVSSCKKDLEPQGLTTTASVYANFSNYPQVLAKLYTAFAISGQTGGAGNPDIAGIDEGFSNYLRELFNMEELTTDEASIQWNDGTIHTLHDMTWNSQCEFIGAMFDRIYYEVSLDNEFLRNTTPDQLSKDGISGSDASTVTQYRAEARYLRALAYFHAIDLFGNVPLVTESNPVGVFFPQQKTRTEIFNYVESELKAIEPQLGTPKFSYGHADQAACWALLARLYLNAKVYTGTDRSTDCITYCNKIISSKAYSLDTKFQNVFLADNNTSPEMIFPIESNGVHTQGYGGVTYLVHAQIDGNMNVADFGVSSAWAGFRTTSNYVSLFSDPSGNTDQRAMFSTKGQSLDLSDEYDINTGYTVTKFKNVTKAGVAGSDPTGNFVDTDFPMFRFADVYLMYAEAVLRGGGGGDRGTALGYINDIRTRAYGGSGAGNITDDQLTLPFILNERGREMMFEMTRRSDLIRFGAYTGGTYIWQWKGGVHNGQSVDDHLQLMPIPQAQIVTNPTLKQNPGYN